MTVEIHRMTEADLPALAELERLCFADPWSENALREELEREGSVFLTAEENGKICGYAGMQFVLDEGYMTNVAVHPDARRKGIGKQLMTRMWEEAERRSLSFLSLEVRESNLPAIRLYEGLGFETAGRRKRFYQHPQEDALIMTRFRKEQIP